MRIPNDNRIKNTMSFFETNEVLFIIHFSAILKQMVQQDISCVNMSSYFKKTII